MTTDEFTDDEKRTIRDRFHDAVNMTAKELEHWLGTDESKEVGHKPEGGGESVGHESGPRSSPTMAAFSPADVAPRGYPGAGGNSPAARSSRRKRLRPQCRVRFTRSSGFR